LFVPDAGTPLLVELGWLPLSGERTLPQVPPLPGARRISGLLLPPPSAGLVARTAVPQADGTLLATGLDMAALAAAFAQPAIAPRVLRLDPATPLGYARDLDVLPNTLPPERHLGYAVQWFALALAALVTALVLTFRKGRP
jgi:cytochrome oxidase assembly protein ShyY1